MTFDAAVLYHPSKLHEVLETAQSRTPVVVVPVSLVKVEKTFCAKKKYLAPLAAIVGQESETGPIAPR